MCDDFNILVVTFYFFMNKKLYLFTGVLALIASVVCLIFDWRISTGIIIGLLSSYLYFYILNVEFKIEDGQISKGGILGFFLRILVIALPLFIACVLPNVFNIFGAFAGVMIFRIIMMIVFYKERENM